MRYAAIDVGTNSTRVYVAERVRDGFTELERDLEITRLGQGVDAGRALAPEAIERTVAAVKRYADRARSLGADRMRIAATSAVRDASNRDAFLDAVRKAVGVAPDVLSGEQEAALSFAGAAADLPDDATVCVLDIGGGSTELVVGRGQVDAWISLDVGSVRLTERCIGHDPPTADEIVAVERQADDALTEAAQRVHPERAERLVGLAGTITTIAAVHAGIARYDRGAIHHMEIEAGGIDVIVAKLAAMTSSERRALPVMPPGREDVIVAGGVILQRVMRRFGFGRVVVSESDILDGLVASMVEA